MLTVRSILAISLLLVTAGCTSRYQIRGTEFSDTVFRTSADGADAGDCVLVGNGRDHRTCQFELEHQSIERFGDFEIGIIEISDDGLFNTTQKKLVMERIVARHRGGKGLLIVFVHGWHHSARTCDRDLACFREVLTRLTGPGGGKVGQNITGLFIGWRGESIYLPKVNVTTIYDRKRTAQHIGRTAGRELFTELTSLWEGNPDLRMVTVGHSLGGAFVLSAVRGKLTANVSDIELGEIETYRVVRARTSRREAEARGEKAERARFGNLLVLVNPAIESYEYTMFDADLADARYKELGPQALVEEKLPYDKNLPFAATERPILVTLASEEDTAVGWIFPFSRILGGLFLRNKLSPAHVVGLGHLDRHVTHHLSFSPEALDAGEELAIGALAEASDPRGEGEERGWVSPTCECTKNFGTGTFTGTLDLDLPTQEVAGYTLELTPERRKRGWAERSPYIVIRATEDIISEHSDIFNPRFVGFLNLLLDASDREISRQELSAPRVKSDGSP